LTIIARTTSVWRWRLWIPPYGWRPMTPIWKVNISLKGRGREYDPFRHKTKYEKCKSIDTNNWNTVMSASMSENITCMRPINVIVDPWIRLIGGKQIFIIISKASTMLHTKSYVLISHPWLLKHNNAGDYFPTNN